MTVNKIKKDIIREIFIKNKGYCTFKEMRLNKVHTSTIRKLSAEKNIEKIKPGLYKLAEYDYDSQTGLLDVCKAEPAAVICLVSALSYYDLTTQNAYIIDIAIPNSKKAGKINYPPVKYHFFRENSYLMGIETIKTTGGTIKIYNREKTICDLFRNRRFYGEEMLLESLKEYLRQKDKNLTRLYEYSKKMKVSKMLTQYLKILS
jgi:predicted transcriptional regulator of viral defense system